MDKEKIKIRDPLSVILTLRITQEDSNFLREKKISPQGLFREAISDLRKEQITKEPNPSIEG